MTGQQSALPNGQRGNVWENQCAVYGITNFTSRPPSRRYERLFIPGASPADKELTVSIIAPPPCDAIPGLAA